jgi:hypothetical protein
LKKEVSSGDLCSKCSPSSIPTEQKPDNIDPSKLKKV